MSKPSINKGLSFSTSISRMIQSHLKDYFMYKKGQRIESLEIISILHRSFSTIVHIGVKTDSSDYYRLVAKRVVHHDINKTITDKENQATVEFNILQELYPKFLEVEGCSVPRPIIVMPETETYIMEYVAGMQLTDEYKYARYFSSKKNYNSLKEHMFLCGRWLKHFHQCTGLTKGDINSLHGVINRCESRLKLIEQIPHLRCPKNLYSKVMGFIKNQYSYLLNQDILLSGRHSDFTPFNIIAGSFGICVIDFMGYGKDAIPVDLLKMMVYLEDEIQSITSSPKRIECIKECFIKGYGTLPHIPIPILLICETMQRVVSLCGNLMNSKIRLHHHIDSNRRITSHIDWLKNDNKESLLYKYIN